MKKIKRPKGEYVSMWTFIKTPLYFVQSLEKSFNEGKIPLASMRPILNALTDACEEAGIFRKDDDDDRRD